jgi:hypothetical protein
LARSRPSRERRCLSQNPAQGTGRNTPAIACPLVHPLTSSSPPPPQVDRVRAEKSPIVVHCRYSSR